MGRDMEWISREDRLPEYNRLVLLYDSMFDRIDVWYVDTNPKDIDPDYTHWMPLPEPPNE